MRAMQRELRNGVVANLAQLDCARILRAFEFFHRLRRRRFLGVFTGEPISAALSRGGRGEWTQATAPKVTS